jgi:hypothetical protein
MAFSISSLASVKVFSPQETVKASDINDNFNEVQQILNERNGHIDFNVFNSGDLISKEVFENEFDKARNIGITVDPLMSEKIIANELNHSFSQLLLGAQTFDDIPVASNISISLNEDTSGIVNFMFNNIIGISVINIVNNPEHGSHIPSGDSFIYSPYTNYSGEDSFSYQISDGVNLSNVASVQITILPENDDPVANTQSYELNEDSNINITLSGSDV